MLLDQSIKLGRGFNDVSLNYNFIKEDERSLGTDFQFRWMTVFCEQEKEYFFPGAISPYMLRNYNFPAIYRWIVYKDRREQIQCSYIGTTKQLCPGRLEGYLYRDSSNTDLRLRQEFGQFIKQGYKVGLESLLVKQIKTNNIDVELNNLHTQTARIFIENLLITYYRQRGLPLLNLG